MNKNTLKLTDAIAETIGTTIGQPLEIVALDSAGGGSINRVAIASTAANERFFVKLNDAARLTMFEAEMDGLEELAQAGTLRVPRPVCAGCCADQSYLVLEFLDLAVGGIDVAERLGRGLAQLHRHTLPRFGWRRDNNIGTTPQRNDWLDDWPEFFRDQRLGVQLGLISRRDGSRLHELGEKLSSRLPLLFAGYRPVASLLHGDLWAGNAAATRADEPVIFDPAVYYGDREADIAMTELFGGFSARFYDAYREAWPLDSGYALRKTLYNLYHVLNHFNIFGGGYGAQAERMMRQLLANIG